MPTPADMPPLTDQPNHPSRLRRVNRRLRIEVARYRRLVLGLGALVLVLVALLGFTALRPFGSDRADEVVLLGEGRAGVMEDSLAAAPVPPPAPAAETLGTGEASYYGGQLAGRPTASGESFDPAGLTAAHRTLPLGSTVRVTNLRNDRTVVVRINDRGPYAKRRVIDLSEEAARRLGMIDRGVANVQLELLP